MYIDEDPFVVQLTVGQLINLMKKSFPILRAYPKTTQSNSSPDSSGPSFTGRLVHGIKGIEDLFNVSHKTAQHWKETWLKAATKQRGRKIITDVAYAMKLFDEEVKAGKVVKRRR